jgi:hypothetical protein
MSANPFTLDESLSLTAALHNMKSLGVRAMAVVGPDGFRGLLAQRDAEAALRKESDGSLSEEVKVSRLETPQPESRSRMPAEGA